MGARPPTPPRRAPARPTTRSQPRRTPTRWSQPRRTLTGRPPFPDGPGEAVLLAHLEAPPPRVTIHRPDLPPAIDQVIARALAKSPEDRFPSCRALVAAAREALFPSRGMRQPHAATSTRPFPVPVPGAPEPHPPIPGPQGPGEPEPHQVIPGPPNREGSPTAEPRAPVVHSPQALEGYLPLRRPGRRVRRALWLSILLALASAAVNLADTEAALVLFGDQASGGLYLWVGAVQAAWFLVTAGLWLAWFRRAYLNLPALGARRLRFRPWWAVGAWLLPVFSLFRPKQLLNDIWRASDPDLPPDQAATWRGRPVAEVLGWWWLAFVASVLVRSITTDVVHVAADFMLLGLLPEQFDRFQPSAGMQVLADLLTVLCGLLALRVVRRATARQQARATRCVQSSGRCRTAGEGLRG